MDYLYQRYEFLKQMKMSRASTEIAVILAICTLVSIGSTISWTAFGAGLNRFLQESPRARRAFNIGMALLLVLSIVPMVT